MDSLKRTANQFAELFGSMTASQRGTLIVVPLLLLGAFGMLLFQGTSSSYVGLSWGKVFTTEELIHAEQTLREAGLTEFRREGAQIMVPEAEAEQYNAALLANGGLPSQPLSEFEKQLDKRFSIWTGQAQLQAMKDIALEKEINRTLRAVPDVHTAFVKWARSDSGRFSREQTKVTATVSVRPRPGREVTSTLVRSMQDAVASMIPDLLPKNVTVFDLATGESHIRNDANDEWGNEFLTRTQQFQDQFRREIKNALGYIPNVLVTVKVDLDNLRSSVEKQQTIDPKRTASLETVESTRSESSDRRRSSGEPGQASNSPRSLAATGGGGTSQSISEQNSRTVNAPSFVVNYKEFVTAMPQAVQVSVAIPEDYYQAIAAKQSDDAGESTGTSDATAAGAQAVVKKRADVERDVKATVARAIGAPDEKVTVTSYVRVAEEMPVPEGSFVDEFGSLTSQWGGAVGLVLFALWALWMVSRSAPRPSKNEAEESAAPAISLQNFDDSEDDEDEEADFPRPPEPSTRDRLQMSVRDNPEMAASVLTKWIRSE